MVSTQQGAISLRTLLRIQNIFDATTWDEDETAKGDGASLVPEWARKLSYVAKFDKLIIPIRRESLDNSMTSTQTDTRDPVCQALRREVKVAMTLTNMVKKDIRDIVEICNGTLKPTNHHRNVMQVFSKEGVPSHWKLYSTPASMGLTAWIQDFANRLRRLEEFASQSPRNYRSYEIHLGSLFFPEAFITASRQSVARELRYPLEQLEVSLEIGGAAKAGEISFNVVGLCLEAACFQNGQFKLVKNQMRSPLPSCRIVWRKKDTAEANTTKKNELLFALYLNSARSDVLCVSHFPVDPATPTHLWYQSGVCMVAWSEQI
jgi:dynein heavy chain 1